MNFTFAHNNLNVYDLDASLRFYKEALGLTVTRTKEADDGSLFISVTRQLLTNSN
jgi:lactoylglutathione lyase